jgi:hypothetical protein
MKWLDGVPWDRWHYDAWNERLIAHYFRPRDPALLDRPVDSLPATPEDLAEVAGATSSDADQVAAAFVAQIAARLPKHKISFCRYCSHREQRGGWTSLSSAEPHFFGMLWFTCLVAYGYPTAADQFFERVRGLLGKADNFRDSDEEQRACLPRLWREFAEWTRRRRDAGDEIRVLELPPESHTREVIGFSHFLAFPNREDRGALAKALWESGLVGFEPPIQPVVKALETRRKTFSKDFLGDLDEFVDRLAHGDDPRGSPFWRAVRREALTPVESADNPRTTHSTGLLWFAGEDGLRPIIVCDGSRPLPLGFESKALDADPDWDAYVSGEDGDVEAAWREAFDRGELLPLGLRKLVGQGLLVLRERSAGTFEVATGSDIQGCDSAIVRRELTASFVSTFGGESFPSIVDGWNEVTGCRVRQLDELPAGLDAVTQLMRTMSPPAVGVVGGVHVPGAFLFSPAFLPRVRAPEALRVAVRRSGSDSDEWRECGRLDNGDWALPEEVNAAGEYTIRATWQLAEAGRSTIERSSETPLRLVEQVVDDAYKSKPKSDCYVESCPDAEREIGDLDEVPLGITSGRGEDSADFLELDASARFLGPGEGEMSLERESGFDWLVLGPKGTPDALVFVGDTSIPTPPAERRSPRKGDRTHWRAGFSHAKRYLWRTAGGEYANIESAPDSVREMLQLYRRHRPAPTAERCRETALETLPQEALLTASTSERARHAVDVLAALACRRSGLTYPQVRDLLADLIGADDPILIQQVLQAWAEAGVLDLLRTAVVTRTIVVARRPRFVLVRRGPEVDAALTGLVTTLRRKEIELALERLGRSLRQVSLPAPSPWLPSSLRLRGDPAIIEQVRDLAGLGPSEWLAWRDLATIPPALDVRSAIDALPRTAPPDSFRTDAVWDWKRVTFSRGAQTGGGKITLERRVHRDFSTIYVVLQDGRPTHWTYSRSWALLLAHAMNESRPFHSSGTGTIWSRGRAPVHLPLALGRLCSVIGEGVPGPRRVPGPSGDLQRLYPFGRRFRSIVERVLPDEWVGHNASTESTHAGSHR